MVTPVTKTQVQAILNGQTTEVAKLKSTYKLGSFGYNFFKLFSCFLSTADKAKMIKAENMDTLPGKIKKTADKVAEIINDPANQTMVLNMVQKKQIEGVAFKDQNQTQGATNGVEKLADAIKDLTAQAHALAESHGHDAIEAYVGALSDLIANNQAGIEINGSTLKEILGQNFLVDSTVRAQTIAFSKKPIDKVASGFEAFIAKVQAAFPGVDATIIYTRLMKQLCKLVTPATVEAHIAAHSQAAADAKVVAEQAPFHAEIATMLTEVETLRGTNSDGTIHEAWLAYMKSMCTLILEIDSSTGRLSQEDRNKVTSVINNPDELKKAESFINDIFAKDGFTDLSLGLFTAKAAVSLINTQTAEEAKTAALEAKAVFDKLKAREVALVGDGSNAAQDISDAAGTVIARVAPDSEVATKFAELQGKGSTVSAEYQAIRTSAANLFAKITHAKAYFARPETTVFTEFVTANKAARV